MICMLGLNDSASVLLLSCSAITGVTCQQLRLIPSQWVASVVQAQEPENVLMWALQASKAHSREITCQPCWQHPFLLAGACTLLQAPSFSS